MQKITMTRQAKSGSTRYYKIELFATLFGEYVVEREYGSTRNKTPTGVKKNYFEVFDEALEVFESLLRQKKKKGYL